TYVVGLKTEDIEIETLDNRIAGEIIHNVLEKIYEGVKTLDEEGRYKKLSSLPNIVIDNYIIDQFKKKFNDDEYFLNISSFELIFIRFYIRNVLKNENNVYFGLGKDLLEEDLSHQVNIQGHNVTLGGSVDRIIVGDQVKIIDYKTGNSKFDSRKVELDEDFKHFYKLKYSIQLKLYKYIYFKKYGIHSESIVFSKAGGDYESKEFKYNVIEGFKYKSEVENRAIELLLEDIITKVYQEEITQTEDTKVCQYCNFKGVCLRYEKIKDY
ncbi:MAG: PD-(D/E)XK nuclease family protein, partial [Bacteroidota bacterium]|nr:PD-(D/E)XK nuclease family protein [Bacteroidota bacterium]